MSTTMLIKLVPVTEIRPYERNSKKHDAVQVKKIAESIRQFGWDQPIVVDADNVIIKGHGRRLAAIELGLKEAPVLVRADLTPEQVRAARLADNRVALSDIDTELMRAELADLNYDLAGIFDDKELDFGLEDLGAMSAGAFIDDIDAAVNEQEAATKEKIEEIAARQVPINKVLGFFNIPASEEITVARMLQLAESRTQKKGADAFVEFARLVVENQS